MTGSDNETVIKCRSCGYTMDVPSGFHDDGSGSSDGRTAKCPRCGYVNTADSPGASDLTVARNQQILRRI